MPLRSYTKDELIRIVVNNSREGAIEILLDNQYVLNKSTAGKIIDKLNGVSK